MVGEAGGCNIITGCLSADLTAVRTAVADADVVLAFVGLHPSTGAPSALGYGQSLMLHCTRMQSVSTGTFSLFLQFRYGTACAEGEAWDRGDIELCGEQPAILQAALNSSRSGTPLVTVLVNGGTISAPWIKQHSTSVLEAWCECRCSYSTSCAANLGSTQRIPSEL